MRSTSEVLNDRYGPDAESFITVLASAARTATTTSAKFKSYGRGLRVFINTSAGTPSPGTTFKVQEVDPLSGTARDIITSAAVTGVGLIVLTIYPGLTPVSNVTVSDVAPKLFQVVATAGDADSHTYSVSAVSLQ